MHDRIGHFHSFHATSIRHFKRKKMEIAVRFSVQFANNQSDRPDQSVLTLENYSMHSTISELIYFHRDTVAKTRFI